MPDKALRQGANWVALELCTCQTLHAQLLSLTAAIHRTVADGFNVSGIPADFSARPPRCGIPSGPTGIRTGQYARMQRKMERLKFEDRARAGNDAPSSRVKGDRPQIASGRFPPYGPAQMIETRKIPMRRPTSWLGETAPVAEAFDRPFDIAVVIVSILRPGLLRAVRSVYAQDFDGRVQILVGIDRPDGDRSVLDALLRECPDNMALCVIDPGYSTAANHGGLYSAYSGGALRTILSYMAHAVYVAYLDDDNWFAPGHLSSLRDAVTGYDWGFSFRIFVSPHSQEPVCIDEWESVGPGRGIFREKANGFADPNTIMLNKLKCHVILPHWSTGPYDEGRGCDRIVFDHLQAHYTWRGTGRATSFYTFSESDAMQDSRLQMFRSKGIERLTDAAGQPRYVRRDTTEPSSRD
jgi:hypothetical protein